MYTGPTFHTVTALDAHLWEVRDNTGKRIGGYPNAEKARKVADSLDRSAMRQYLKARK